MAGYLIAEEGPLLGQIICFEEGLEWTLGRDPDEAGIILEDPMVSRKHVVCRFSENGYLLENLSSVNPITQNGRVITEPILLQENDIIQIGSTFFRFTQNNPLSKETNDDFTTEPDLEDAPDLSTIDFDLSSSARWMLKVISGPNAGAEFSIQKSSSYIIGKDPNVCEIAFQDLSVSRQHARLTSDEGENIFIEDLGSRNGVLVNGELILDKHQISSQDLIALGTTTFLIIDREQVRETIYSPPSMTTSKLARAEQVEETEDLAEVPEAEKKDWKDLIIQKRHLLIACMFGVLLLFGLGTTFSLFKSRPVLIVEKDKTEQIREALKNYTDIQFSFNQASGKLFLMGHVLSTIEYQELLYIIKNLPFISTLEDNVIVDELVWQNMNALLSTNSEWLGITIHSPIPGRFVMRGYLQNLSQGEDLSNYINLNFPYLDRLDNQVVIESNLITQIQSVLTEKRYEGVQFQISDGELVLSGRVNSQDASSFHELLSEFKGFRGVRTVKNFVVLTTLDTSMIDLSSQYQISGYSKKDEKNLYVVINGKILAKGDLLDGMMITGVQQNAVLLEKGGLKFKIDYNLQ